MISETISEAIGDDQALERIRPDLNIEKWSIWQPANSRNLPSDRTFERELTLPDGSKFTAQVEVGFTGKGTVTTEDQKTYYALVRCWEDKDCPVEFTPVSLRELARVLHKKWGTNVIESLTGSLTRLRVTPFIWRNAYYDSATGETIEELEPFTILSKLKIFRRKKDGGVYHGDGYFQLDEHILTNISNNHTKPLLFDTAISFRSEIAQIIYTHLDLVMADKYRYERRTEGLFDELGLKGKMYVYPSKRKEKLEPALKELEGKPLSTGVLISATLERTVDGTDWKVVFTKSKPRKSRRKSQGKFPKAQALPPENTSNLTGLAQELYDKGIRPESKAQELVETYPEERIKEKIEMYDAGIVKGGGGLVAAIEDDWQPTEGQQKTIVRAKTEDVQEKIRELNIEKGQIKKAYEEKAGAIFEKIIRDNEQIGHEALQEVVDKNPMLGRWYEAEKSFAEHSMVLQSTARSKLKAKFPDAFKEIDEERDRKMSKIDKQIDDLKSELKAK